MLGYLRSGSKRTKAIWWALTIITVFTFLIGFSFFGGLGRDPSLSARMSGALGKVNGRTITSPMWQAALDEARANFHQRFNSDPIDRDLKQVEQQAWRQLVNSQLMTEQAEKLGLKPTDNEIVVGMKTNPPQSIYTASVFQTDGKFDPNKYGQALRNPNIDWSPFEAELRSQLPVRMLQERLMSSLKLSEGELHEAFHDRYDRLSASVLQVQPTLDTSHVAPSEAQMQAAYERYKDRFSAPARTQLEILTIPVRYSADEVKSAQEVAQGLYERMQKGEDFAGIARDNSEGANPQRGGVIDRFVSPSELGPIGTSIAAHRPGDILPPYYEGGQVVIFRILDPARDSVARNPPSPGMVKLAQVTIKVRASSDSQRQQYAEVSALQKRAKAVGLGKAATEKGLSTSKTQPYNLDTTPPQLYSTPEAADWGLGAKKGDVSPVFVGAEEYVLAQVSDQHAAGPPAREDIAEQLKQLATVEHGVDLAKPLADKVSADLKSGHKLEDEARPPAIQVFQVQFTHQQPDPRIQAAPELQGALWAAHPGQVVGPVRTPAGWFFARLENISLPPDTLYNDTVKGQITTDILTRRQRSFFDGYLETLRSHAKIADLRTVGEQQQQ